MVRRGRIGGLFFLAVLLLAVFAALPSPAEAQGPGRTLVVSPNGPYRTLQEALAVAQDGDRIEVRGGTYFGPIVIDRSVILEGVGEPVLDGRGEGSVVKITASDVVLRGFVVRNSGDSLDQENSGIVVTGERARIEDNRLEEILFGIYLREAHGTVVRGNRIVGKDLPLARRGDLIRIWSSRDVVLEENEIRDGRDVVLWYSDRIRVRGNRIRGGRYGIHFMYCDDALVEGNVLENNSVGTYLMYSRRLHLKGNLFRNNRGPSGFGIGLKDLDDHRIEGNLFVGNRVGAFLDNSPREIESYGEFSGNLFAYNDIGVALLPSVRRNRFWQNIFLNNDEQVAVEGGGRLEGNEWAVGGIGNFWSDYAGFDADGDGIGDVPYRSQRLFEHLMDRYPSLRLFLYSPVVGAMEFAARAVPAVRPQPKLEDPYPLVTPPLLPPPPAPFTAERQASSLFPLAWALLFGLVGGGLLRVRWSRGGKVRGERAQTERRTGVDRDRPLLEIQGLTKRFGETVAVRDLSFTLRVGEGVALWGPNGAGKTTTLKCLLGLLAFEGEIRIAGQPVGRESRRWIGYVPQDPALYDWTGIETLRFFAVLRGASEAEIPELAKELGLEEVLEQPVRTLSGGMRQRLALALALLGDPPLLLLDEPTANLDASARRAFLETLQRLKARGKGILFCSHRWDEVQILADRVLVLDGGKKVAEGTPAEVAQTAVAVLPSRLRLYLPSEERERAREVLEAAGFPVQNNGYGLVVAVPPGRRGEPFQVLARSGLSVLDFELEG